MGFESSLMPRVYAYLLFNVGEIPSMTHTQIRPLVAAQLPQQPLAGTLPHDTYKGLDVA